MKKVVIPAVLVVAVLAVLGARFLGRSATAEYRFVEITRGDVRSVVTSTGTLQAITTVQVGTQVSGKVSEIHADFNDRVTRGQLIARIDPVLLEQAVRAAEADLARNRAELAQAQREFDRISRLYDRKAATESEHNTAQYRLDVARAALVSAEVNLERARQNLGYSEIRAPVDGVVLDRSVDEGQTVAASLSAPQLFLIAEDLSKMEILAAVDESDIGKIHAGQPVDFTVQAYPDSTFHGTVDQVRLQSTTQENVVNYVVSIAVDNPSGRLLPGMTATAEFVIAEARDVLRVPNAALRFRPTEAMLAELRRTREVAGHDGAAAGDNPGGPGGPGSLGGADGPSGPGGPAGRGGPSGRDGPGGRGGGAGDRTMLWILDDDGNPAAVFARTGLTDGQYTELKGPHVEEGLQVIAAVVASSSATAANPFQGRQETRRRGPPPGM
ncbi:MAG: efflux RND transporter periplasmic adaptor subunit [Candidatus Krumholzibacteriia bacterium]